MKNEKRINLLEAQIRVLKKLVFGFWCLLAVGVVIAATNLQTTPEVIQAESFEIVDVEGQVLVVIDAELQDLCAFHAENSECEMLVSLSSSISDIGELTTLSGISKRIVELNAQF